MKTPSAVPTTSPSGSSGEKSDGESGFSSTEITAMFGRSKDKRAKAARLLLQGRLRVLRVDSGFIFAECRGDSGEVYNLSWRDQRWTCSCPARTDCSHLNALWAVVAVNRK